MSAPAGRLRRFLLRHCSAVTMERLVDPILTDIRIEAAEASLRGPWWASLWIRCTGLSALVKALAIYGWNQFWRFHEWPVDDRRVLVRTLAFSAAISATAIPLLALPVLIRLPRLGWGILPRYLVIMQVLHLLAQTVVLALPIGLLIGLIYGFKGRIVSLRSRTAVMIVAILCAIASFVALAWVAPAASQAFGAFRHGARYATDMTIGELRAAIAAAPALADGIDGLTIGLSAHYHLVFALAAAPIVLTLWSLILVPRLPNNRLVMGVVSIASCVAYYFLMGSGRAAVLYGTLPPVAGVWLPNIAFLLAIVLVTRRTPNEYLSRSERRTTPVSF
jgi:Lipopolysaccharide export system permease LptF/LptG